MTDTINYLRRCADNKVLEASLNPAQCLVLVQMIDHLEAERDKAHQDAISAAVERDELAERLAEIGPPVDTRELGRNAVTSGLIHHTDPQGSDA